MPLPKDPQKAQEYREKQSRISKARCTPEYREKMSRTAQTHGVGLWMKGRTFSTETKLKMSEIAKARGFGLWMKGRKGKIHSVETRLKMSQSHKARLKGIERVDDLRPHQGGSWESVKWRIAVYERDDYTCKNCLERGGELNAHHIFWWSEYPIFRYEVWNGVTLCVRCHKKIHRKENNE